MTQEGMVRLILDNCVFFKEFRSLDLDDFSNSKDFLYFCLCLIDKIACTYSLKFPKIQLSIYLVDSFVFGNLKRQKVQRNLQLLPKFFLPYKNILSIYFVKYILPYLKICLFYA